MRPLAILAALALLATPSYAQSAPAPDLAARRSGIAVYLGGGWGVASGGISEGGTIGAGSGGIAYERPFGGRNSWRVELSTSNVSADIGLTGDIFVLPSTLVLLRSGIGVSARRYGTRGLFASAGAVMRFTYDCWVDQEGGPGFLGGESIECEDMTDPVITPESPTPAVTLSGGAQRGRWELEIRYEHSFGTSVRSDAGTGSARSLLALVHYRFGRSTEEATRRRAKVFPSR